MRYICPYNFGTKPLILKGVHYNYGIKSNGN